MDIERIRRIEDNIEAVGGVENYINEVYNNSSDISDLSFYINKYFFFITHLFPPAHLMDKSHNYHHNKFIFESQ